MNTRISVGWINRLSTHTTVRDDYSEQRGKESDVMGNTQITLTPHCLRIQRNKWVCTDSDSLKASKTDFYLIGDAVNVLYTFSSSLKEPQVILALKTWAQVYAVVWHRYVPMTTEVCLSWSEARSRSVSCFLHTLRGWTVSRASDLVLLSIYSHTMIFTS